MFRRLILLVGFVGVFVLSAEARATTYGTVHARFQQVNPSSDIEIHYPGGSYSHGGGTGVYRYRIDRNHDETNWSEMDIFDPGSLVEWFPGFCMELTQYTNGWDTYTVKDLESAPVPGCLIDSVKTDLLSEFWGEYGPQYGQWESWDGWSDGDYAEAFQVGIWELIYENDLVSGYDVTAGDVWVNPAKIQYSVVDLNDWLNSLDGTGTMATLRAITHPNYQDVLVVVPGHVPEPVTVVGVLAGIGALGGYIRRRRKLV